MPRQRWKWLYCVGLLLTLVSMLTAITTNTKLRVTLPQHNHQNQPQNKKLILLSPQQTPVFRPREGSIVHHSPVLPANTSHSSSIGQLRENRAISKPLLTFTTSEWNIYFQKDAKYLARCILQHTPSSDKDGPFLSEAVVTFFAQHDELPALETFVYSFVQNHVRKSKYHRPLVVAIRDNLELQRLAERILRKYDDVLTWQVFLWPALEDNHQTPLDRSLPLQLWTMTSFHKLLFVDIGMLILNPLDNAFSVSLPTDGFLSSADWDRYIHAEQKITNFDVFLMTPSIDTLKSLLSYSFISHNRNHQHKQHHHQHQHNLIFHTLLHQYFRSNASTTTCCLPTSLNMNIIVSHSWPTFWNFSSIQLLRYGGEKPWTTWSTTKFREQLRRHRYVLQLIQSHQWNADEYIDLYELWKIYYYHARQLELQELTMFVGYHAEETWRYLKTSKDLPYPVQYVRLAGEIRPNTTDIDASSLGIDYLSNAMIQRQLGEYGTLLVAAKLAKTKFVGISSWKHSLKADLAGFGASIDWTKVDLQENTIYYWLGVRLRQDFHSFNMACYPGYNTVMKQCLPFASLPSMPADIYMYGHYIILSKTLLDRYVKEANQFLEKFIATYPHLDKEQCPLMVKEQSDRCIGYGLERFLDIWAVHHNISRVFAVDHLALADVNRRAGD